jgi:cytochrome c553
MSDRAGFWPRAGALLLAFLSTAHGEEPGPVPDWLYPEGGASAPAEPAGLVSVPESDRSYTREELADLYRAPDWHPDRHGAMPEVVASGRRPDVYACGYCHTPGGQGRPENASLAGLSASYIRDEVEDFARGERRSARAGYRPAELMIETAKHVSAEELASAANYFAAQTPRPRVRVVERARVPRATVVGLVYAALPGAGEEAIGERLLEFAPEPARHESRDEAMLYTAYAPPGSVGRGRLLARAAGPEACARCHGEDLRGVGDVPRLAGRSPTYLLRELYAFRTGARAAGEAEPMVAVATQLSASELIDVAAYAASLPP